MHRTRIPRWATERGRKMFAFDSVDLGKTALVVVDLQNAFLVSGHPAATAFALPILPRVNRLIAAARNAGCPIVFLRQTFDAEGEADLAPWQKQVAPSIAQLRRSLVRGAPSHDIHEALDRRPEDLVIDKYRHSAFARHSSNLDEMLRSRGIDTLIITGAMTNVCCECTARDAYALGYRVFFISDATAALTNAEHNAALLNLSVAFADVRNTRSMLALMKRSQNVGRA